MIAKPGATIGSTAVPDLEYGAADASNDPSLAGEFEEGTAIFPDPGWDESTGRPAVSAWCSLAFSLGASANPELPTALVNGTSPVASMTF